MKIALVNPDNGTAIKKENLGLLSIGTYLKSNGFDVCIIDEVAEDNVYDCLSSFSPDVVGISFMTMFAPRTFEIAREIRKRYSNVKIVFGGAHPSACPEECLPYADVVIVGEGEISFLKLLKENTWKAGIIEGVSAENIDIFPIPDRTLINIDYYLSHKMGIAGIPLKSLSMTTSRGCPYRCIFCQNSKRTVPVRTHSIERVMTEIRSLIDTYALESIAFVDENFAVNKKRLCEFCRMMIAKKLNIIKWECQTSSHCVDEEVLSLLKEAGAVQVAFGFESGSQRILDIIGKTSNLEQNKKAAFLSKKAGLKVRGCFIIGNPTETVEDIRLTQRFILETEIDYTGVFLATPFPGTVLWDYCLEHGLLKKETLDFASFTTGADSPALCTTLKESTIKKLYAQTVLLSMKKNYSFLQLLLKLLQYRKEAFKLFRNLVGKQ